ncbi:Ig-like domain-containing protein [Pontibacter sp. 13R65]|uniref:Ig-like domain-containing protein n=1 Tax=Pontibacter sp. 13R65 TaxID=3127458 RepID=UPI00301DD9B6
MRDYEQPKVCKQFFKSLSRGLWGCLLLCVWQPLVTLAQKPVIKVDFNFSGRKEAEVHAPGYDPWAVAGGTTESRTFDGVRVGLNGNLASDWYKAGVQSPINAKLANDGLFSEGQVEIRFSGLPAGRHSLLTWHNTFANPETNTVSPIAIYIDGEPVIENLMPSNRVNNAVEAQMAYLPLDAKPGRDLVVRFVTERHSRIVINGFELNTPDLRKQAQLPQPADGDEHVDGAGKLTLSWTPAKGANSHDVYFGTSANAVAAADRSSGEYRGNQNGSAYAVENLYSMLTYYWRVDEVDASGKITKGRLWFFRPRQLAFPGAEGYGRFARGGRGGKVVEVTNLNNSGPGSLREAVTKDIGPRTVVFAVSGIIELKSRLVLNQPYVTIAGQTAPGKGITIRSAPFGLTGNDGVIRHLRVRLGGGTTFDGMGLTGADNSIIDHCSISWTIDEAFSSRGGKNITLQRTLISEALNVAGHKKYTTGKPHGYAATIGGDVGSFHHNLLAHNAGRNWSLGGGLDGNGIYTGRMDIRNNVVYNWDYRTTDGGAHEVNFVNNYYKPGAATTFFYALNAQHERYGGGSQRYYFDGNVMPGHFDEDSQEAGRKISGRVNYETFVDKPFFPSHVTTHTAREAYKHVLSDVGCNQPALDEHDRRIVQETLTGTYKYKGSISGKPGLPDSQEDVGGWEHYPEVRRQEGWDTDHDGLPDWWEQVHGLNVRSEAGDFSDSNSDTDKDGFTNLDLYLDWMAQPHFTTTLGQPLEINLGQLSRGFTDKPAFSVSEGVKGKVKVQAGRAIAHFTPEASGLASFSFTVTDAEGSTMTRTIGIHVKGKPALGSQKPGS